MMRRDDVTELAAIAGVRLTAGQERLVTAGMRKSGDGAWAQFQVAVPDGQDEVLLVRELAGMFLLGERVLHVSAGHARSAEDAEKMTKTILGSPDLARRVSHVSRMRGGEMISLWDGDVKFRAQPLHGGHAVDLLAFGPGTRRDARVLAALLPCLAGRPDPQVWMAGALCQAGDHGHLDGRHAGELSRIGLHRPGRGAVPAAPGECPGA
jgi:hypothetical protein